MTVNEVVAELQKVIALGRGDEPLYADDGCIADVVYHVEINEYGVSVWT